MHKCMLRTWIWCEDIFYLGLDYICNHMEKFQSKIRCVVAFLTDDCLAIFLSAKK